MKPRLNWFMLSVLLVVSPRLAAYDIKLFPASAVYDADLDFLHERLGVEGQQKWVEDFESEQSETWLTTNLRTDLMGNAASAWAGQRASAATDSAEFGVSLPRARVFGVGLANNGNRMERLSINHGTPIELKRFPGHEGTADGRAFYLLVIAQPNDPDIHSIVIDQGQGLSFDHLMVLENKETSGDRGRPARFVLQLADDTRVTAHAKSNAISVVRAGESTTLAFEQITSMRSVSPETVEILLRNGRSFEYRFPATDLVVTVSGREISIPWATINRLRITPRGEFSPEDSRLVRAPESRERNIL